MTRDINSNIVPVPNAPAVISKEIPGALFLLSLFGSKTPAL